MRYGWQEKSNLGFGDYTSGLRRPGEYYIPEPTPNVPYPVRHQLQNYGNFDGGVSPEQLTTLFGSAPLPGNENRGQYTETPATLDAQRTSSSAPTTSKSSGAGGSLPSTSSMPDVSQLQAIMRSF